MVPGSLLAPQEEEDGGQETPREGERMSKLDIQAARERCEAATDLTMWAITAREDGFCVGNGRGHNVAPHIRNQADAELFVHARSDLSAALKLIEHQEPMVNQYKKIVEWLAKYVRSGESTADLLVRLSAALEEAQDKLESIKIRLLEIVEEEGEVGVDSSYLFSMLNTIDPTILGPITPVIVGESE